MLGGVAPRGCKTLFGECVGGAGQLFQETSLDVKYYMEAGRKFRVRLWWALNAEYLGGSAGH